MNNRVTLLSSGGLDSTTVAYMLSQKGYEVYPIFFDYGQHCADKEWQNVNDLLPMSSREPERITISDIYAGSKSRMIKEADLWSEKVSDEELYIPYRTLLFFAAAASRAQTLGINEVYTGFINSNHAKEIDCSTSFLNGLEELANGIGCVNIISPLREFSKLQVLEKAIKIGVPVGKTFSCQVSSNLPCGACPNCVERLSAIKQYQNEND